MKDLFPHHHMCGCWRDERYYIPDGNIVILVSRTLFKVHRSILAQDGSTFENMFSLDTHSQTTGSTTDGSHGLQQEGGSDESPIQMQGDTDEEFRNLLWSLYALPQEIALAMSSEGDIMKLSNVARMAHKYHFITTEAWALHAILTCLVTQPARALHTHSLVQVTEVAVLCDDSQLLNAVRTRWKGLIVERKDLAVAMITTERLGLRDLQGMAYHAMMLQGRSKWDADPLLNRDQRIRLLSGHHNLTMTCDSLPTSLPEIDHRASCRYPEDCQEAWACLWKQVTNPSADDGIGSQALAHDKLDLPGRMMMAVSVLKAFVEGAIPQSGVMLNLHDECSVIALERTAVLSREIQEGLMDFFEDVK